VSSFQRSVVLCLFRYSVLCSFTVSCSLPSIVSVHNMNHFLLDHSASSIVAYLTTGFISSVTSLNVLTAHVYCPALFLAFTEFIMTSSSSASCKKIRFRTYHSTLFKLSACTTTFLWFLFWLSCLMKLLSLCVSVR